MNQGQASRLLKNNQLANATNLTVRGDYAKTRPAFKQITFNFSDPSLAPLLQDYFQGGCYYRPDFGDASLMASVAGRLLQFQISGNIATITDQSIPGDFNTSAPTQSWLWQSENYVIVNDGQNLPIFFDGNSSRRSLGPAVSYGQVASNFSVPQIGSTVTNVGIPGFTGQLGQNVLIDDVLYQVQNASGYAAILTNLSDTPGKTIPSTSQILSEPSVWGVLAAAHTFPTTTIPPFSQAAILTLTLPSAKVGDKVFIIIPLVVHAVSGKTVTLYTQGTSLNAGGLTLPKGQLIHFASNNQPNVTVETVITPFVVPAVGQTVQVTVNGPYQGQSGAVVFIGNGQYQIAPGPNSPLGSSFTLINLADAYGTGTNQRGPNAPGTGNVLLGPGNVTSVPELPAGRMGAYGLGRNWMSLTDGRTFIAGDIVGGPSGTAVNQFRDAVLKITENTFLFEGGVFTVPSSGGDIRAMCFAATLDVSLGQGPLQVFTQNGVFSCNAPVDRSTWESITNPILTESLIDKGATGQNSTTLANGDILFRSPDGERSLILGRRDFFSWGNVPQSREVQPTLDADDQTLLNWGSSVVFGNRLLQTAGPTVSALGVYHPTIVAINFDPLSTLTTKQPSVYDGLWNGLNVLQFLTGTFNGVERCFAFTANPTSGSIELWEILPDASNVTQDNGVTPISVDFTTADLMDTLSNKTLTDFCRLSDGELAVDNVTGPVTFQVFYKPDQYAKWVPWFAWSVDGKSTFYPRMGLGEPDGTVYDEALNRPTRNGFSFQVRFVITGSFRFLGARFKALPEPQPDFAPQAINSQIPFTANVNP